MRWINSEDRLPKHGVSILVEYRSGSYVKMEFNGSFPKDWWERNILRWLDESEPSFSIENMKKCWNESRIKFPDRSFSEDFETFMYNEYNIDLTK